MKKTTNMIEYSLKGAVSGVEDDFICTEVRKKDDVEEDNINLVDFKQDIIDFFNANQDKNIELKFSLKVVEE